MTAGTFRRRRVTVLFMAFFAQAVSSQLETAEFLVRHIILVMARNAFFYFHTFHIRILQPSIGLSVVTFTALKTFLLFFMGKTYSFFPGRCLKLYIFRPGVRS
jgi:hypothetical protein